MTGRETSCGDPGRISRRRPSGWLAGLALFSLVLLLPSVSAFAQDQVPPKPDLLSIWCEDDGAMSIASGYYDYTGPHIWKWQYRYKKSGSPYDDKVDSSGGWQDFPISSGGGGWIKKIGGLTIGATYTFQVRAVNTVGPSVGSDERTAVASVPPPPAKPSRFEVVPGNRKVTLSAEVVDNGGLRVAYWFYRYKTDGDYGKWKFIPGVEGNSLPGKEVPRPLVDTDPPLTNGTDYTFQVRAENGTGYSEPSDEVMVTPSAAPTVAISPANGRYTKDADTSITLTFSEAVYSNKDDNIPFDASSIASIVTLKSASSTGPDIGFSASINGANTVMTVTPTNSLADGKVYVAVSTGYYTAGGARGVAASATFTVDTTPPAKPVINYKPGLFTVTFSERVYSSERVSRNNSRVFDHDTAKSLLTLKLNNADIPYTAHAIRSGNEAFKQFSLALDSDLGGGGSGNVSVEVSDGYYDFAGNQGASTSQTYWLAGNSPPPPEESDDDDPPPPPVPVQPVVVQTPPPAFSVADATSVTEGAGEPLAFTVSLDRAVLADDGTVSVAYATRDVTATAGADYTSTSGTLSFAVGESSKIVNVTVLEDAHPDGGETLELVLSNATGATITDGTGTGTIKNAATMPRAWTARFGRTIGTHITDAVSARLRDTGDAESHLTVAGWRMPLGSRQTQTDATRQASATDLDQGTRLLTGLAGLLGLNGQTGNNRNGPVGGTLNGTPWLNGPSQQQNPGQALTLPDLRQALVGSAFRLNLNQNADGSTPRLTAWGRVTHTQFDGQEGRLALDGDVTTGTLGVDTQGDRWLAGIAVSHSRGDGGYTIPDQANPGDLETTLTSLHPYLRYALTDRLTVWGLVGYGWGDLTLTQTDGTAIDTDTDFLMGAVGSRGLLLDPATTGGLQLATRLDAMFTRTSTEAAADMAATDADAHRLRLVLEGSRRIAWAEGRHLTPTVEVGLRHDWGDAETGFGVEVGGRVQYADPGLGLTVEGAVRALVAHEAEAYDEWGASGTVRLAPGAGGQGLALTLQPAWGATASGVEALWGRQSTAGLAPRANQAATGSLAAEVGYGVPAFDTGLVTPYAGTILAEGASRTYRVGTRLLVPGQGATGLTMTLEGLRQEPTGLQPLNQGLRLQATWGF